MKLLSSFAVYTLSGFINAGIPFLILPILTKYLSPGDYGIVSLFSAFESFVLAFVTIGIIDIIGFEYFRATKEKFRIIFSNSITLSFICCLLLTMIIFCFAETLSQLINLPVSLLLFIPFCCYCFVLSSAVKVLLRNQNRPKSFSLYLILATIFEVLLTLYLVIWVGLKWQGRIGSHLITAVTLLIASFCIFNVLKILSPSFSMEQSWEILKKGGPLIFDSLSVFVLEVSDRFFIAYLCGMAATGIYSVGSQIAMVILVLTTAFSNSFFPLLYKTLKEKTTDGKVKIVKTTYIYLSSLIVVLVLLSFVITPILFDYIIDARYSEATRYVFWVGLGYFFLSIHVLFKGYLLYNKKVQYLTFVSILVMVTNLVLNFWLINMYGEIGAAYATAISYCLAGLLMVFFAVRNVKMPWLYFLRSSY